MEEWIYEWCSLKISADPLQFISGNETCIAIVIKVSTYHIVNCSFALALVCLSPLLKRTGVSKWRNFNADHWSDSYTWKVVHRKRISMRRKKFLITMPHRKMWSNISISSSIVIGHRWKRLPFVDDCIPLLNTTPFKEWRSVFWWITAWLFGNCPKERRYM